MNRKTRRKAVAVALLVALLAGLTAAFLNYRATRHIGFGIDIDTSDLLQPPTYLYSFSGTDRDRMSRPIGLAIGSDRIYVADSRNSKVYVCSPQGSLLGTLGQAQLRNPLYVAIHPRTGDVYVSDRRLHQVLRFDRDGKYLGVFDPKLPKEQLPKFETGGAVWQPVAMAFAPDGRFYVTDILKGHRLLAFDSRGAFKTSTGSTGIVLQADQAPEVFQFPNSVCVHGDEVWVADSNNRRIQVFDLDGKHKRLVPTSGLPRGVDFLARQPGAKNTAPDRLVVIDTLAHDATIWNARTFKTELSFGGRGVLEGQFSYPHDVAIGDDGRIFISDTSNGRVQVWGWPEVINPVPTPKTPSQWALCLSPLLLLLLPLAFRKRRVFATRDFIESVAAEDARLLTLHRMRWYVSPEDHEALSSLRAPGIDLATALEPFEGSETDARAIMERLELEMPQALLLACAQRSHIFCTQDVELRRLARSLDIEAFDHEGFAKRFGRKARGAPGAS